MPETPAYAAIDLGASTGRVLTGRLDGGRIELQEVHRFPNRPTLLPDGLRWNLLHLYTESLEALRGAGPLAGVGVDTWGVDYALLDDCGRVLGLPFHYRDGRTAGMVDRAFARVPQSELYAVTGIQTMAINTVFQLLADEGTPALAAASRIALVPDLLAYWLSGELANERTAASTTGLLDAHTGAWSRRLVDRLGLPRIFGTLVDPGTALGPLRSALDLGTATVAAVAGHDTASAFVAAPLRGEPSAILSSGTWSLLGLELPHPVLDDAAREANLTNERGIDGTTRLLKNVMGLWLEQECARVWGADHAELYAEATRAPADVAVFDPDDETFLQPGDMPARIAAACLRTGQRCPETRGETVRSILVSLACKYRYVLERLQRVTGETVRRIHVIGGGVQVSLLCQLTADLTGCEVVAGPTEATALGNVLVQARAAGELGSLAEIRAVAAASTDCSTYEPGDAAAADEAYARFLAVSGLRETTLPEDLRV